MVDKVESIWFDGELIAWDEARVHVLTHTLHYGLGAFEGIRAYKLTDGSSAVFRLDDHIDRLLDSSRMIGIECPYGHEQLARACIETLQANHLDEAYLRPIVFLGSGAMGLFALSNPVHVAIATWRWGAYLGEEGVERGIRVCVSSFARLDHAAVFPKGKVCGHYVNSILAKREAMANGFDEAIMLDPDGYVAEGSGENIFAVRRGVLYTPPFTAPILGGITRESVIALARDEGIEVVEQRFPRDFLYLADEIFLTGTAAEVTPVREVDRRPVGRQAPGPITRLLQRRFKAAVRGEDPNHRDWLTVYTP